MGGYCGSISWNLQSRDNNNNLINNNNNHNNNNNNDNTEAKRRFASFEIPHKKELAS